MSAIGALTANSLRPDGLALVSDWSAEAQFPLESGESLRFPLKEAERLFRTGKAVFVDARSCEIYEQGHIRGARCLPWQGVEKFSDEMLSDLSRDTVIIAYCDGEGCSLSKELALKLLFRGYEQVRVLVNRWTLCPLYRKGSEESKASSSKTWQELYCPTALMSPWATTSGRAKRVSCPPSTSNRSCCPRFWAIPI